MWNDRDDNDIDEIVIKDVAMVHVEQMTDRCWWIGIDLVDGGYWSGNFVANSRGLMRFAEQDCDFAFDQDESHQR